MVINSTNIHGMRNNPRLHSLNTKKTTKYDVGNPRPGFRQKCGGIKPVYGIPFLPS